MTNKLKKISKRTRKYKNQLLVALSVAILCSVAAVYMLTRQDTKQPRVTFVTVDCNEQPEDYNCWRDRYKAMVQQQSPQAAFADIKQAYEKYDVVRSQCHQLIHVMGREAAAKYKDTVEAYDQGDNFCWSGYYHGVMEGIAEKLGSDKLAESLTTICENAKQKNPYGFYHYNCVHGLGHGLMAINSNKLFDVLTICQKFKDLWEQESCYSGTFMENIMAGLNADHPTTYLKPDDPLYPCTAVDSQYKQQCYLMQTSHALTVVNGDFSKVFSLCASIESPLDIICYQSLGRDASGRSISNLATTKATCLLGPTGTAQTYCVEGAVKDFISYHHSDKQGLELCRSFEQQSLQDSCVATAKAYYSTF